jgi:hypothetical protein
VKIIAISARSTDYKSSASIQCEETGLKLQPLLSGLLLTGSVAVLVAMPAKADVVQVTDVQLKPTATGLEIILKTASGASPQVFTTSYNQTLLIDVSNAQLNLPEGQEFRSDNPIEGITSVTVTPLSANSIRVTVTGYSSLTQRRSHSQCPRVGSRHSCTLKYG